MTDEKKALPRNGVLPGMYFFKSTDAVRKRVKEKYIVPIGSTIIVSRQTVKFLSGKKLPNGVKAYEVAVYTPMHRKFKS